MIRLLQAEWKRLWKRKLLWGIVGGLPVAAFAAATYYEGANQGGSSAEPQYAVVGNFPVLAMAEMLLTLFNLILMALVATLWTEEIRSGQLRMVLLRVRTFSQLWWAKVGVLLGTVALLMLIFLGFSYLAGYWLLPHTDTYPLFFRAEPVGSWEGFGYNLQYYGLSFLTLVAFAGFLLLTASLCRTVTGTLGAGMAFLLLSFFYPELAGYFRPWFSEEQFFQLFYSSLPMIQWEGIVNLLADQPQRAGWLIGVLAGYTCLFGLPAYLWFSRQDQWN